MPGKNELTMRVQGRLRQRHFGLKEEMLKENHARETDLGQFEF